MRKGRTRMVCMILIIALCISGVSVSADVKAGDRGKQVGEVSVMEPDMSISAENSFGKLIQDSLSKKKQEQKENNGFNVFSIEMQGKKAAVSMETGEDCTLVVGIYEEDGVKMLATGKKEVTRGERDVALDVEIDTMPEYFLVRAFLIETETLNPLCTVYETPMYTKEMQDFLSKTTDDFEKECVLNLDEDKTNNFVVFDDDTKIIREDDNSNRLKCTDEEKQVYVIENADASAISLSKGDIFAYEQENKEVVIVKVQSVSVTGTTVTINGEDTELEDVFEYVKIDETATTEDMEVDSSTCSEEVEYQGKENNSTGRKRALSGEGSTSVSLSYKFVEKKFPTGTDDVKVKLSGEVKLSIKTTLKVYLSLQYQYLEYTSKYSLANDWKGEVKAAKTLKLGEVSISPVPGLYIKLTPSFLLEGKTSVSIKGIIDGCTGYSASPQDGFKDLTSGPSLDDEKTELKIEGSIFLGLSLEPSITAVSKKLVKASAEAKAGLELTLSNDYWETLDDAKEKHDCKNCFEGEVHAKGEISASLKFFDNESFGVSGKEEKKFKISNVYLCIQHGKFAFSSCPYHQYKVTVIAKNPDGTLVKDATVNQDFQTNSKGEAYLWFARGKHKLSVSKNGKDQVTKVVDVAGKAQKITVTFKTNSVVDDGTGDGGDDNGDNGDNGNIGLESNPLAGKKIKKVLPGDVNESAVITENGDLYVGAIMGDEGIGEIVRKILSKVKQVRKGGHHKGAITENGDLYMWGDNEYGQIGDGTTFDKYNPIKVLSNVKEIAFGNNTSGAITENGDLYMWGNNVYGQIGDGTTEDKLSPVKVLSNVKEIALCYNTSGAITENGDLYMWGCNDYGQIGDGTRDEWGAGTREHKYIPVKVLSNVKEVVVGTSSSGAITENGDLYMWGNNVRGGIGDGTTENKYSPVKVLSDVKKFEVSSGAITKNGDLYMWGDNEYGQIGDGTTENKLSPVKVLSNVKEIAFGLYFSGAITENGDLYMWGNNKHGQIGDGTREDKYSPVKVLSNAKEVAVSMYHGGAITEDGDLYMWGYLGSGQIEDGTNESKYVPLQINAPLSTTKKTLKSNKQLAFKLPVKSFENLDANATYNYYILKSKDTEDVLSGNNQLYIGQGVTDSSGILCATYEMKEDYEEPIILLKKLEKNSVVDTKITVSDLRYNKQEQYINPTVTYRGETLEEGKDYELSGDFSASEIGTYTVTICGIGYFTGSVDKTYQVSCSHKYGQWQTIKKPTASATGSQERICVVCGNKESKTLARLSTNKKNNTTVNHKKKVKKPSKVTRLRVRSKKKKMVISWRWQIGISGFQIQYALNKRFTKKKKTKNVGRYVDTKTIKGLKRKKTYYVRVRAFKKVSGKKVYGKWSKVKKVKIK